MRVSLSLQDHVDVALTVKEVVLRAVDGPSGPEIMVNFRMLSEPLVAPRALADAVLSRLPPQLKGSVVSVVASIHRTSIPGSVRKELAAKFADKDQLMVGNGLQRHGSEWRGSWCT